MGGKLYEEAAERIMGLTNKQHRVRLKIESGWMLCPRCRKKIFKPLPDTSGQNLPIYCDNCKITWITSIRKEPNEAR